MASLYHRRKWTNLENDGDFLPFRRRELRVQGEPRRRNWSGRYIEHEDEDSGPAAHPETGRAPADRAESSPSLETLARIDR